MIEEIFFEQRDDLFNALTKQCTTLLRHGIETQGRSSFLVSGGSTPLPLFQQLSQQALSWKHIDIALVDERWVNPGETGSNETFIADSLLQNKASEATFFAMKNDAATAKQGEETCEKKYKSIHFPFDLCILGMGADGHTASLFPQAENLEHALSADNPQLCAYIQANESEVTGKLTERMSLTLNAIRSCKKIILLITGEEKLEVYKCARDSQDFLSLPMSALLHSDNIQLSVYWAP